MSGHYGAEYAITYESLSSAEIEEKFDVVVCNFSLLGNESVNHVFHQAPFLLNEGGSLIVQTIHPLTESREQYKDGWREGSWVEFNHKFRDPAPWYFRTLENWETLFLNNGFKLSKMLEPLNKKTKMSASVIFIGVKSS
jgi:2-polyprenyl-3-methyl-5-hydroxy-6-metoxy-1,4-benzoquinol methylase